MKGVGGRSAPKKRQRASPPQARAETPLGETIQRLRTERGLSLRTFAARTGFSPSFVSQVENGQASPSIASLERFARALRFGLADFFPRQSATPGLVMHKADRSRLTSQWSKAHVEPLVPPEALQRLEGVLINLKPGGRSGKEGSAQPREQLALVLEGEVILSMAPAVHVLTAGDAAAIPANSPHSWENRTRRRVCIAVVVARSPR
jgi:transcriptional regulator with XRE-family HTH domain